MTQKKKLTVSIIAGLFAALCAILFLWTQAQSATAARTEILEQLEGGAKRVLVARDRIESGTILNERLFTEQTWPGICLQEGTISVSDFAQYNGHRTAATILRGEALSATRIAGDPLPLDQLTEGMTALTLPAEDVSALGGEILRGMRLTLMADAPDGRVIELAADIEVLSANIPAVFEGLGGPQDSDSSDGESGLLAAGSPSSSTRHEPLSWVTLAVPSQHAEQILTASRAGTIHLVLPKSLEGGE